MEKPTQGWIGNHGQIGAVTMLPKQGTPLHQPLTLFRPARPCLQASLRTDRSRWTRRDGFTIKTACSPAPRKWRVNGYRDSLGITGSTS